jgi:hypothetical protein
MMEGLECQDEDLQFIFYSLGSLSELDDMLNLTSLTDYSLSSKRQIGQEE